MSLSGHSDRHVCAACLEKEYEAYRHARVHELMDRNQRWMERFRIRCWPRWDYDFEKSMLTFSENGHARVVADMIVVGSVQGTEWEWAWGNRHMPESSMSRMAAVKDFGEQKGWQKLTTLFLESDEYLGWELTAVASHLLNSEGAYRCPNSDRPGDFVYVLTFNTSFVA